MITVLIFSAVLIFTPILLVQYKRSTNTYSDGTLSSGTIPAPSKNRFSSYCTAKVSLLKRHNSSNSLHTNSSASASSNCWCSQNCSSGQTTVRTDYLPGRQEEHTYDGADSNASSNWRYAESFQLSEQGYDGRRDNSNGGDKTRQEKRNVVGDRLENVIHSRDNRDGSEQSNPVTQNRQSDRYASSPGERIDNRGESKKPWQPPFPTRVRTVGESTYRVLPNIRSISDRDFGDREIHAEKNQRRTRSTSGIPLEHEDEDALGSLGHLPVTEPLPYGPTLRSAPPLAKSSLWIGDSTKDISSGDAKDEDEQSHTPPAATATTDGSQRPISIVQAIVLVLSLVIFVFAFAILVAHCLAWFVAYKTEVRLGELRKGLLRGGDMRVCLCAR